VYIQSSCGYSQAEQKVQYPIAFDIAGAVALDVFSEWRSLYIDDSGNLHKARINAVGEKA